jgi:Carboxypeptidase regulatory-like domain
LLLLGMAALLGALLLASASAQAGGGEKPKPYALIFGTVWDPDGRPLYGVKVKIRRAEDKKARWELYSNHTGEFAQRVPSGKDDYIVWADVKGYKSSSGKRLQPGAEVTVHIDNEERSDIGLHLDWY